MSCLKCNRPHSSKEKNNKDEEADHNKSSLIYGNCFVSKGLLQHNYFCLDKQDKKIKKDLNKNNQNGKCVNHLSQENNKHNHPSLKNNNCENDQTIKLLATHNMKDAINSEDDTFKKGPISDEFDSSKDFSKLIITKNNCEEDSNLEIFIKGSSDCYVVMKKNYDIELKRDKKTNMTIEGNSSKVHNKSTYSSENQNKNLEVNNKSISSSEIQNQPPDVCNKSTLDNDSFLKKKPSMREQSKPRRCNMSLLTKISNDSVMTQSNSNVSKVSSRLNLNNGNSGYFETDKTSISKLSFMDIDNFCCVNKYKMMLEKFINTSIKFLSNKNNDTMNQDKYSSKNCNKCGQQTKPRRSYVKSKPSTRISKTLDRKYTKKMDNEFKLKRIKSEIEITSKNTKKDCYQGKNDLNHSSDSDLMSKTKNTNFKTNLINNMQDGQKYSEIVGMRIECLKSPEDSSNQLEKQCFDLINQDESIDNSKLNSPNKHDNQSVAHRCRMCGEFINSVAKTYSKNTYSKTDDITSNGKGNEKRFELVAKGNKTNLETSVTAKDNKKRFEIVGKDNKMNLETLAYPAESINDSQKFHKSIKKRIKKYFSKESDNNSNNNKSEYCFCGCGENAIDNDKISDCIFKIDYDAHKTDYSDNVNAQNENMIQMMKSLSECCKMLTKCLILICFKEMKGNGVMDRNLTDIVNNCSAFPEDLFSIKNFLNKHSAGNQNPIVSDLLKNGDNKLKQNFCKFIQNNTTEMKDCINMGNNQKKNVCVDLNFCDVEKTPLEELQNELENCKKQLEGSEGTTKSCLDYKKIIQIASNQKEPPKTNQKTNFCIDLNFCKYIENRTSADVKKT